MLPDRTCDTMSDAIALSSPSGRISKRARAAAEKRLSAALFGDGSFNRPEPTIEELKAAKLQYAAFLRGLAKAGMKPRVHTRLAERLEAEAAALGATEATK